MLGCGGERGGPHLDMISIRIELHKYPLNHLHITGILFSFDNNVQNTG